MEAVNDKVDISYVLLQKRGRPGQAIVDYAERGEFDLVVLGSRGLGRFDRLLLGSTSDAVLHHSNRAALIVR